MKPRRENGAVFVSPITSEVSMGSALIVEFPRGWCGGSGLRVLQRVRFGAVRDQNRTGIMDFQMLSNPGSQQNRKDAAPGAWEAYSANNCCGTQITSLRGRGE